MHNNIMAAGSRDRPPCLQQNGICTMAITVAYECIGSRPNGDALRKCILKVETVMNMTPENRAHFESEKEAIHLILTRIGDEIYSTVDACQTAQEMWNHRKDTTRKLMNSVLKEWPRMLTHLALVYAQTLQDPYYQTSKPHKSYAPTSKASLPTRSHATTRYKGKEIAKPITTPSESASEEDSDPEQAQRDKDM
ncbi:hypothetical protein Tco_0527840 [Tanacetum coccineum]